MSPAEEDGGKPLDVIHVDTATEWRGGQVQLVHLVRGMLERGHRVRVACVRDAPLWQALDGVERLAVPAGVSPVTTARLALCRSRLVAAHTSHAHSCCLPLRRALVVHRRVDFVPSGGLKYRRPDGWVAVSNAVCRIIEGVGAKNVHVVHDGVAPLPPTEPAADGPQVLAVGARVAHKGHAVLADAARFLPDTDIGVAGEGPLVYPGLRWLGLRDDVPALLARAAVFVHPSLEEGMGQVVVEAMLAGVPVVVSDAGGLPEVVGDTGIVVKKGDPVALADGIRRALDGERPPVERAAARARALFDVDGMVGGTIEAYRSVP